MKNLFFILSLIFFLFCLTVPAFSQGVGKGEKLLRELEKEKELRERIEKEVEKPEVKKEKPEEIAPPVAEEKVLI